MQDSPLSNSHVEGHRVGGGVGSFGPSTGQHFFNLILTFAYLANKRRKVVLSPDYNSYTNTT
jgi:hypothetical protein